MGSLNPHLRDVLDFQHKLWDQLLLCLILNWMLSLRIQYRQERFYN
jgi:cell shape-determining protein MreD